MNKLYSSKLRYRNSSIIAGELEGEIEIGDPRIPWHDPIISAFLDDDDIQEITLVSTCVGFVKTLTKQYAKREGEQ